MTSLPKHFISCDWGTTNFRLELVETQTLRVIAQCGSDRGIRSLHHEYGQQTKLDRVSFYSKYLKEKIHQLPIDNDIPPVVISGMASSNMGLMELEYATLPFDQSAKGINCARLKTENGLNILLISGVRGETGMMRGEETQALGLEPQFRPYHQGILILPGTHSKHLTYENGSFIQLKNFMTGELFEVISKYSILSNSVLESNWDHEKVPSFREGFNTAINGNFASDLFSIRADQLLKHYPKQHNYYRLSGMLIGIELSYLKGNQGTIFLAAPRPLFHLYRLALEELIPPDQLVLIDEKDLGTALLLGQRKILTLQEMNQ